MNNQVTGFVKEIQETKVVSEKFSVQNVIVETDDKYPQLLPLQFANDQIQLVDKLNVGDLVQFNINISGREWKNPKTDQVNYFVSLNCWSFDINENESSNEKPNSTEESILESGKDDLPF